MKIIKFDFIQIINMFDCFVFFFRQKAFNIMKKEHSEKMAELCTREEEAKKQVKHFPDEIGFNLWLKVATWEQMYREWMATMERRVNNLQGTNDQLQVWKKFFFAFSGKIYMFRNGCMTTMKSVRIVDRTLDNNEILSFNFFLLNCTNFSFLIFK